MLTVQRIAATSTIGPGEPHFLEGELAGRRSSSRTRRMRCSSRSAPSWETVRRNRSTDPFAGRANARGYCGTLIWSAPCQRAGPCWLRVGGRRGERIVLGVAPVSLDPVGHRPDPRRRRDHTADPRPGTRPRKPLAGRPSLVDDPDRRRQRPQPGDRRRVARRDSQRPHLAASLIDHARDHRPSMHIKTHPATFAHNRPLP